MKEILTKNLSLLQNSPYEHEHVIDRQGLSLSWATSEGLYSAQIKRGSSILVEETLGESVDHQHLPACLAIPGDGFDYVFLSRSNTYTPEEFNKNLAEILGKSTKDSKSKIEQGDKYSCALSWRPLRDGLVWYFWRAAKSERVIFQSSGRVVRV